MSETLNRPRPVTMGELRAAAPGMLYGEALYLHSRGAFGALAASQAPPIQAGPPPLWTLEDVARFLRLEHLDEAVIRSRLGDLRRERGFPGPLIRGSNGGTTRYDPQAIARWLEAQRDPALAAGPAAPPPKAAPLAAAPDFNLAALKG